MYFFLKSIKHFFLQVTGINKFKKIVNDIKTISRIAHTTHAKIQQVEMLVKVTEERSRTLESIATATHKETEKLEKLDSLIKIVEKRTQTLEYLLNHSQYILNHQIDQQHKFYVELSPYGKDSFKNAFFDFTKEIELKTDFPIALNSHDHLMPDSTAEGLSRPTLFVRHCIDILGVDIKTLDIGTGAAGLVYEWAVNGILAAGIDGSDFCRKNKIGYWPLLPNNLLTCDITKPFKFTDKASALPISFDIITSWEVLEHIAESDLSTLFENVKNHLNNNGYFIGSVSLISYMDTLGNPYHVTLKPRAWWKEMFKNNGLEILDEHPFNETIFCRGNGPRFQDFHNYKLNPEDGFLFVAKKLTEKK